MHGTQVNGIPGGRIAQRVGKEVADGAAKQITISMHARRGIHLDRHTRLGRKSFEVVGNAQQFQFRIQFQALHRKLRAFRTRQEQHAFDGAADAVAFFDIGTEQRLVFVQGAAPVQGDFVGAAQIADGRAQVVCQVHRELPYARKTLFQACEHVVQRRGQREQFGRRVLQRHARAQALRRDGRSAFRHHPERTQRTAHQQIAQQDSNQQARQQGKPYVVAILIEQGGAVCQRTRHGNGHRIAIFQRGGRRDAAYLVAVMVFPRLDAFRHDALVFRDDRLGRQLVAQGNVIDQHAAATIDNAQAVGIVAQHQGDQPVLVRGKIIGRLQLFGQPAQVPRIQHDVGLVMDIDAPRNHFEQQQAHHAETGHGDHHERDGEPRGE
jgi:hypothetical protein